MSQEETHVQSQGWHSPPPPRMPRGHRLPLKQLWNALPEENRHRILQTLSGVIRQHLRPPPERQEVDHDRD